MRLLVREHSGGQEPAPEDSRAIDALFAPYTVAGQAQEDYNLETAAWIGATLEQGVWYQTEARMMMPGITQLTVPHEVELAFTHRVPCVEGQPRRSCAEIVVHARPRQDSVTGMIQDITQMLHLRSGIQYWSATYLRIIVDPDTLTPYRTETRRHWHIAYAAAGCEGESALERIPRRSHRPASRDHPARSAR